MTNSTTYGMTANKKRAIKAFLMLIVAGTMILGTSGCGSSLEDSEVIDKVEELAPQYSSLYRNIKCRYIVLHLSPLEKILFNLGTSLPGLTKYQKKVTAVAGDFDEMWKVKVEYGRPHKRSCDLLLLRRGDHFYIVGPPED